jgi:protein gp37
MGDKTGIEWTDATWNPVVGCSIVSPGCTNCYAMKWAGRALDYPTSKHTHYHGTTRKVNDHIVWSGKVAVAPDHILLAPLKWKSPRKIFVNSMGDLFHESVPDEWIDKVFAMMALCPQHTFQVLTKRSKRMREFMQPKTGIFGKVINEAEKIRDAYGLHAVKYDMDFGNVWLGVSAEDQTRADERIPDLLATPAAVRFVSAEPLLGPIDFTKINTMLFRGAERVNSLVGELDDMFGEQTGVITSYIKWMICGGESGHGARPMHPDWVRSIRDQCQAAGTAFFFKQWGEFTDYSNIDIDWWNSLTQTKRAAIPQVFLDSLAVNRVGKTRAGNLLDGKTHNQFPEVK